MCFLHHILEIFHGLSLALQSSKINWVSTRYEVQSALILLSDINRVEILKKAGTVCDKFDTDLNATGASKMRNSKNYDPNSFLNELIIKNTCIIKEEFLFSFNEKTLNLLASLEGLDASSKNYLNPDSFQAVIEHYPKLIINETLLQIECKRAKMLVKDGN